MNWKTKQIWIIVLLALFLGSNGSAIASEPQPVPCAEIYVVQANDWLSIIADKFFGNIEAYSAIMAATNQQHKADSSFALIANPDVIEVGWKLCVPITGEAETILSETYAAPADEWLPKAMPPSPQNPIPWTILSTNMSLAVRSNPNGFTVRQSRSRNLPFYRNIKRSAIPMVTVPIICGMSIYRMIISAILAYLTRYPRK